MLLLLAIACRSGADTVPPIPVQEPARDRLVRLTHDQYRNAVRDVLGFQDLPELSLIGDPLSAHGFDNDVAVLQVTPELWVDYALSAERLAREVVLDDALYAGVAPEDPRSVVVPGEPIAFDASQGVPTVGGEVQGGWMLWSWGTLDFGLAVEPGPYRFEADVWATQAGSDLANAALLVDGVEVQTFDVQAISSGSPDVIGIEVELDGSETVGVGFTNDYSGGDGDRNLIVGGIRLVPGFTREPGGVAERDAWIRRMGRTIHRRPLTDEDVALYAGLFDEGAALPLTGEPFRDGVATVLTAMLQSPWFVYRTELATGSGGERVPLDDYELVSRLAFALWNTAPDADLLAQAERGGLQSRVRELAEAMLDDPRATRSLDHFHAQLLNLDAYDNIHKTGELAAIWNPALNATLREQALRQTRHAVTDGWSTFDLLTRSEHWIGPDLAPIYGVEAPSVWTLTDVSGDRSGLLTLPGFLTLNATATGVDTIHRGVFVNHRLLCADLPPPPQMVPPLPAIEPNVSNRERVTQHTGPGTCGGECHGDLINPVGFAFENYDAIGRWQDDDAGPIDASGSYTFSDGVASWRTPHDFNALLADSADVHACLTGGWGTYLLGRRPTAWDQRTLDEAAARSRSEDLPIRTLILDLVTSDSFTTRPGGSR